MTWPTIQILDVLDHEQAFLSSFQTTVRIPDHSTTRHKPTIQIMDLSGIQMVTVYFIPLSKIIITLKTQTLVMFLIKFVQKCNNHFKTETLHFLKSVGLILFPVRTMYGVADSFCLSLNFSNVCNGVSVLDMFLIIDSSMTFFIRFSVLSLPEPLPWNRWLK